MRHLRRGVYLDHGLDYLVLNVRFAFLTLLFALTCAEVGAAVALPPDSLPRRVKKTDYTRDERPQDYLFDLQDPDNLQPEAADYDPEHGMYRVGSKLGDNYLSAPYLMTPQEYLEWTEAKTFADYFKGRNDSLFVHKGKEKFDFTDMHFDLGPAEKIFGPGGVQIKTQGSAELKFGYNYKYTDNPSLSERNRKTTSFDFDEKINLSVNATVGDKMGFNINYNTDATFDFDSKNLKLQYEGQEDEIVQLIEAGNISFPSNNSLVTGATTLFGIRTDLQFGKLTLQMAVSQKKSSSKTVSSKGGSQTSEFEIDAYNYDENRHFFLAHYFRDNYNTWCANLPTITSGITITRVEIWVTNTTGATTNTRDIIGFVDLGENSRISNSLWTGGGGTQPQNASNTLYSSMVNSYADARSIDQTATVLDAIITGGTDYEKVENARLLTSSEYTLNTYLGYVSLKSTLSTNSVLAVAFEYTYGGNTYQVGEFSADITDTEQALFVKLLKNTSNSPTMGNWDLMMKNVYSLGATSVQEDDFELNVQYLSDTTGVYLNYLPLDEFKQTTLLKMMNLDRLDANEKTNPNGKFDFLDGYTINASTGRVIFPVVEPFGDWLREKIGDDAVADLYCFDELYDTTKVSAKISDHDKFQLAGEYNATSTGTIDLGSMNIPQGSVVVTAGGVTLTEGSDYEVDYVSGTVTILNQSIIDAGTSVSVSLESTSEYSTMRKTMLGLNWNYEFNENLSIGGTWMRLTEKALTSKVSMGSEPLNNTIFGFNINWKTQSQWLTNLLDKIPLLHLSEPSSITFSAEYAQLVAGEASGVQGNASYLDDFESTKTGIDVSTPSEWMLCSTPSHLTYGSLTNDIRYGYNRALLAWYNIDPLFTRRSSSLTPGHIKNDLEQLSNHYVREVYVREVYPNKDTNQGESNTLTILNLAYYPNERGPYNLDTDLDSDGHLNDPAKRWGGMQREIDTSDFETANVQYIEFWMLDPFIYTGTDTRYGGDLYINLGDVSEDVLKDGKKYYESGMPVSSSSTSYTETVWGRIPTESSVVYSFSTESNARQAQDIGLNGLSSEDERTFDAYATYLSTVQGLVSSTAYDSIYDDPAGDDYHYFRGTDFDNAQTSILDRYKRINMPEGNSPNSSDSGESYSTAYTTSPDKEDVNADYTMNEYENFFEYRVSIRPEDLIVGSNYIVDSRTSSVKLRNGNSEDATWYQFRIPVDEYESTVGSISDFSSIRFMRMYMTDFEEPIVLRFASLDLVRGEWRNYEKALYTGETPSVTGTLVTASVNIEENNDKTPVNYVLPPGISRVTDPSEPQLTQENEQALALTVTNLATGDARAVYKTTSLDLRQYKHLQMFVHGNALEGDNSVSDGQMSVFIRFGTDANSNYYEYEVPVQLTPAGTYDTYTTAGCTAVWPEENMIDIDFSLLTDTKRARNKARATGDASYTSLYYEYDEDNPSNKVSVMGNPSLGNVKTMMIGVRNNGRSTASIEVWVNELRMQGYINEGGWAAQGNLNVQLSDLGSVNLTGHVETAGFGGLEQSVSERSDEDTYEWAITTQFELGKFFPETWKMSLPLYYSYSWQKISPKYNPFDTDILLSDALDACADEYERDSLQRISQTITKAKNFSMSNWRSGYQSATPMPWDPANFSFSYSYSQDWKEGQTIVYENEQAWKASLSYQYAPKYKTWEPFKNLKGKSKWLDIIKAQNLNYLPQSIAFNTDISRNYYELQERDVDGGEQLPVSFSEQFLWNRELTIRWDIFKSLKLSWTSATHAEIEEPYTVVNKDLYPDQYQAWKDSVKTSLLHFGRPLTYSSTFNGSYSLPLSKIPCFDWMTLDGTYNATYGWTRGTELDDGTSLGHTATTQRTANLTSKLTLTNLYKKSPFLAAAEERFSSSSRTKNSKTAGDAKNKKGAGGKEGQGDEKDGKGKKSKTFTQTIVINDSADIELAHSLGTKHIKVRATKGGKDYKLKYKRTDENTIVVKNRVKADRKQADSTSEEASATQDTLTANSADATAAAAEASTAGTDRAEAGPTPPDGEGPPPPGAESPEGDASKGRGNISEAAQRALDPNAIKIYITKKPDPQETKWYKTAQVIARGLMLVRDISISYKNTYALTLPGFTTEIGDAFGQKRVDGILSPGLDFAFGLVGDDFIQKAADNGWLIQNDSSITTPATTSAVQDLQLKATLEPIPDLRIDLTATRTVNKAKSIQFMYESMPTTQSGSFTQTTISIKSAFGSSGNINNNYNSKYFNQFIANIPIIQQRLEQRYASVTYPSSAGSSFAGQPYDATNGGVDEYSADVLVPAFLAAYTGGDAVSSPLDIFPALAKLLPNWSVTYSGLTKLSWFSTRFKSFNITHAYKSIYTVGSYSSYSSFMSVEGGDIGFVTDVTTGNPIPSSMYNVSTVSINEAFSPLIGVDMTFQSGLTAKLQWNKTRVLSLSMTSVALTETLADNVTIGFGLKIKDVNLFGAKNIQNPKKSKKKGKKSSDEEESSSKKKSKNTVSHDLNLSLDFTYGLSSALNRNIQTLTTTATSGATTYKLALSATYTFSKLLTLSGYLDWQRNVPLTTSSSYPTTTADFGVSCKFSLTR